MAVRLKQRQYLNLTTLTLGFVIIILAISIECEGSRTYRSYRSSVRYTRYTNNTTYNGFFGGGSTAGVVLGVAIVALMTGCFCWMCCKRLKAWQAKERANANRRNQTEHTNRAYSPDELDTTPPPWIRTIQLHCALEAFRWDPEFHSPKIMMESPRVAECLESERGATHGIMGSHGMNYGQHIWEINFLVDNRNANRSVGVANRGAALENSSSVNLVGYNLYSWGLNLKSKKLYHFGRPIGTYPNKDTNFQIPTKIRVFLDMNLGTLAFGTENEYWGVAFQDLQGGRASLFPMVATNLASDKMMITYIGSTCPPSDGLVHEGLPTITDGTLPPYALPGASPFNQMYSPPYPSEGGSHITTSPIIHQNYEPTSPGDLPPSYAEVMSSTETLAANPAINANPAVNANSTINNNPAITMVSVINDNTAGPNSANITDTSHPNAATTSANTATTSAYTTANSTVASSANPAVISTEI